MVRPGTLSRMEATETVDRTTTRGIVLLTSSAKRHGGETTTLLLIREALQWTIRPCRMVARLLVPRECSIIMVHAHVVVTMFRDRARCDHVA